MRSGKLIGERGVYMGQASYFHPASRQLYILN
jgi:hypothetical protein